MRSPVSSTPRPMPFLIRAAIWLLLIGSVCGDYLGSVEVFGLQIYLFRQAHMILLVLSFFYAWGLGEVPYSAPIVRLYGQVALLWFVFGLLSLLWTPVMKAGLIEIIAIVQGFSMGLLMLNYRVDDASGLHVLRTAWVAAFLVTAIIALWELATGGHLPSEYIEKMPRYMSTDIVVLSTFGQPNAFGSFIALCVPFLIWSMDCAKGYCGKLLYLGIIVLAVVLVFLSGSRASMLAIGMQFMVVMVFRKRYGLLLFLASITVAMAGWVGESHYAPNLRQLDKIGALVEFMMGDFTDTMNVRTGMFLDGLYLLYISWGLGVGAGGFEISIQTEPVPYYYMTSVYSLTGHQEGDVLLSTPHNFAMEIASQYGLVVFFAFVVLLAQQLRIFWRTRRVALRMGDEHVLARAETAILVLIGYIGIMEANSTFLKVDFGWLSLASCLMMAINLNSYYRAMIGCHTDSKGASKRRSSVVTT